MSLSYTQEELKSDFRLLFDKGDEHPNGDLREDLIVLISSIDNMRNNNLISDISKVEFEYDDIGKVELCNSSDNTKLYVYNEEGAIINIFYTEDSENVNGNGRVYPRELWGKISILTNIVCIAIEVAMALNHINYFELKFILGVGIVAATVLGALSIGLHSWND